MTRSCPHSYEILDSERTQLLSRVLVQKRLKIAFPSMLMDETLAYPLVWPC